MTADKFARQTVDKSATVTAGEPATEQRDIYKQNIEKPLQLTSEFTLKKLPGVLGCFSDLISCGFIHSLRLLVVNLRTGDGLPIKQGNIRLISKNLVALLACNFP